MLFFVHSPGKRATLEWYLVKNCKYIKCLADILKESYFPCILYDTRRTFFDRHALIGVCSCIICKKKLLFVHSPGKRATLQSYLVKKGKLINCLTDLHKESDFSCTVYDTGRTFFDHHDLIWLCSFIICKKSCCLSIAQESGRLSNRT